MVLWREGNGRQHVGVGPGITVVLGVEATCDSLKTYESNIPRAKIIWNSIFFALVATVKMKYEHQLPYLKF